MASRLAKTPLIQAQRTLAAQAAAKRIDGSSVGVQTSKLTNGVTLTTAPALNGLSSVGVLVRAGSVHETYDTLGASHAIRLAAGLATKNHTAFGLVRNIQQAGSSLEVVQGREYTLYSCPVLHGHLEAVIDYLLDIVSQPQFKRWELDAIPNLITLERAEMSRGLKVSELLHKAAYHEHGLGNSLVAPQHMIGAYNSTLLSKFHSKHYTADRTALVGFGIDHNTLAKFSDALKLGKGSGGHAIKSKYRGGELRRSYKDKMAYVALGAECGTSSKDRMSCMILQHVLGLGVKVKYGFGSGQLHKAVGDTNDAAAMSSFCYNYSDSSLVGAFIATEASAAGPIVEKVAAALRSVNVTENELKSAKKSLCIELSEDMMSAQNNVEFMGKSALFGDENRGSLPERSLLDLVSATSLADVQAVAKKLSNAKLSMAAVGNVAHVPYLESL